MDLKRFGTAYGGFYYPEDLSPLGKDSIVYCVGVGEDVSHDLAIGHALGCKIYMFDPTPRAIKHVQLVKDVLDGKEEPVDSIWYGGSDPNYWRMILDSKIPSSDIIMHEYGLHIVDDTLKFYKNSGKGVSCSFIPGMMGSHDFIEVPVKKLSTIMKELGHDRIDLLKIDIEGVECAVLREMLADGVKPRYLGIDFDLWHSDRNQCHQMIAELKRQGYTLLKAVGQDHSFKLENL